MTFNIRKLSSFIFLLVGIFSLGYAGYIGYNLLTSYTPDFSVYYWGGYDVLHGINPYETKKGLTPFGYPIATGYLFVPLGLFSYQIAQHLFSLLNIFLLPFIIIISLSIIKQKINWAFITTLLLFTLIAFPTKFTLGMGQNNIITYALIMASLFFWSRTLTAQSGILLGLALLLKPIFGILLLFFMLAKCWRIMIFAISVPIFFIILSIVQFGVEPTYSYFYTMTTHYTGIGDPEAYYNQGLTGFLGRLTDNSVIIQLVSRIMTLTLLCITVLLWIRNKHQPLTLFSLLLITILIIDIQSWQHHFVYALFPIIFVTYRIIHTQRLRLFIPLGISYILISWNITPFPIDWEFPYSLLLSHGLYGAVILWILLIYTGQIDIKKDKSLMR